MPKVELDTFLEQLDAIPGVKTPDTEPATGGVLPAGAGVVEGIVSEALGGIEFPDEMDTETESEVEHRLLRSSYESTQYVRVLSRCWTVFEDELSALVRPGHNVRYLLETGPEDHAHVKTDVISDAKAEVFELLHKELGFLDEEESGVSDTKVYSGDTEIYPLGLAMVGGKLVLFLRKQTRLRKSGENVPSEWWAALERNSPFIIQKPNICDPSKLFCEGTYQTLYGIDMTDFEGNKSKFVEPAGTDIDSSILRATKELISPFRASWAKKRGRELPVYEWRYRG